MKKLFVLIILFFYCSINYAHDAKSCVIVDPNWKQYNEVPKRIAALQIKDDVIDTISTASLYEECMNFPYLIDFLFYGANQDAFIKMESEFNGFKELLNREDLPEILISNSLKFPDIVNSLKTENDTIKGKQSLKYLVFQYILIQEGVIEKFNTEQLYSIVKRQIDNNNLIISNPHIFSNMHYTPISTFYSNEKVKDIITSYHLYEIIQGNHKSNDIYQYNFSYISTPFGSSVVAGVLTGNDVNSSDYANYLSELSLYPSATLIGNPTASYNCHGYAWHMAEGGNIVYIDCYSAMAYIDDESYIEVPESLSTKVAYSGDHSAIRVSSTEYISKWGPGCLVRHSPTDVPPGYGTPAHYYKRATMPSVSGPSAYCDYATYTLNNKPAHASLSWTTSYESTIDNYSGSYVEVSKNADGLGSVTANLTLNNGTILNVSKDDIAVGNPSISLYGYPYDAYGNLDQWTAYNNCNTFVVDSVVDNAYNHYETYLYDPSNNLLWHGTNLNNGFNIPYNMTAGWHRFKIKGIGSCGNSEWWTTYVQVVNSGMKSLFTLNYDSSSESVTIIIKENSNSEETNTRLSGNRICNIQLWRDSKLIQDIKSSNRTYTMNLSGMKNGIYVVRVVVDDNVYSQKFIKD